MEIQSAAEQNATPRRAGLVVLGIPALAIVLAMAVWWSTPRLGGLAAYELSIVEPPAASASPLHPGSEVARVELASGGGLSVVLRPRDTNTEPVEATAFLEGETASAPLTALLGSTVELPAGALSLTLSHAVLPRAGRLRIIVGRTGKLPGYPSGTAAHGRDWQRFDIAFAEAAPTAP